MKIGVGQAVLGMGGTNIWPLVEETHFPHCSGKGKGILSHGGKLRESLLIAEVFSRAE